MLPCRSSGHPSGCEWLRVSANCRRGRPQLAARGRNLKKNTFPTKPLFSRCYLVILAATRVAASPETATCGHWPLIPLWPFAATRSHLQPLEWPQVAASPTTASCSQLRSTPAAIRSHSQPLEWQQVAASGHFTDNSLLQPSAANPCGHSQPLAATRSHSSGRKWPRVAAPPKWPQVAAPPEWPQVAAPDKSERVAASGREWPLSAKSISTLKATPLICLVFFTIVI